MADRWSNPSGSLGVHRFRVWPAGTDSYDHTELTQNFDTLDGIVGIPPAGDWPPTTGTNGGIYREVKLLELDAMPIGTVFHWFRPDATVALPDGCLVCDGSVVSAVNHDFPGVVVSVTLPNLLNRSIIGADLNKADGTAAAAVGNGNINLPAGAPGPQATGGLNEVILSLAQIPAHNHGGGNHNHTYNQQIIQLPQGGINYLFYVRDDITHTLQTNFSGTIINTEGSGTAHENRPLYVGLIPLCKVRRVDSL